MERLLIYQNRIQWMQTRYS